MKKVVFKADFERRLYYLYKCLNDYYRYGYTGNIPSAIYKCMTYLYCNSFFKKTIDV